MKAKDKHRGLTAARVLDLLDYDPDTGEFRWRVTRSNVVKAGRRAGAKKQNGYHVIMIDNIGYKSHRLAWLSYYGVWPEHFIDHINMIKDDNRIANLREATMAQNKENSLEPHKDNVSGLLGAHWRERRKKFSASICHGGKQKHLGYYATAEEAHAAYVKAKRKLHSHCTL